MADYISEQLLALAQKFFCSLDILSATDCYPLFNSLGLKTGDPQIKLYYLNITTDQTTNNTVF